MILLPCVMWCEMHYWSIIGAIIGVIDLLVYFAPLARIVSATEYAIAKLKHLQ